MRNGGSGVSGNAPQVIARNDLQNSYPVLV